MKRINRITTFYLILVIYLLQCRISYSQDLSKYLYYNSLHTYAPATKYSKSINETTFEDSRILFDLNKKKIYIKTNFYDETVESVYKINEISDIKSDNENGKYYLFTCLADNYAEVLIYLYVDTEIVRRVVTHNNITSKYFNR